MFDHMVKVNNLQPTFEKYGLTEDDMIFIKELITGTALDGGGDQVPKNQDCRIEEIANSRASLSSSSLSSHHLLSVVVI